jgi:hypothetical protein
MSAAMTSAKGETTRPAASPPTIAARIRFGDARRRRRRSGKEAAMEAPLGRVPPSLERLRALYPDYIEDDGAPQRRRRRARLYS